MGIDLQAIAQNGANCRILTTLARAASRKPGASEFEGMRLLKKNGNHRSGCKYAARNDGVN